MSIKISELTVEQTTLLDGDKQELSCETAPGVWESRFYLYSTLKNQLATEISPSTYEQITLSDFNTLVGASGLVVGKWYNVINAVTHPVYGSMMLLVQATSTSTINLLKVYGYDNGSLNIEYVEGILDDISFTTFTITSGYCVMSDALVLGYTLGFQSGTQVLIGGQYLTYVNAYANAILLDNVENLADGTFGTYDPTTSTFTPNATASGDVVGPASATNNNVAFFDGTTGKLIKDSGLTLSGTNTGDQTSVSGNAGTATTLQTSRTIDGVAFNGSADITVIAPATHAATSKTTPVDADELPLVDSALSNVLKKLTWANLKATLKTYFDTLYQAKNPVIQMSGSVTTTSNVASAITGLSFTATANKVYEIELALMIGCNNTGGVKFSCTIPSGTIKLGMMANINALFPAYTSYIDASATLNTTAYNAGNTANGVLFIKGLIYVGGTGGTVQFNFASGTNTQTSTVYASGTFLKSTEQ
jgi:hypothetical protein